MSEIIAKERILKNVRKGLVIPGTNPFPTLDFDSNILNEEEWNIDENAVALFLENEHAYFKHCANKYEFLLSYKSLMDEKGWKDLVCHSTNLTTLFEENGFEIQVNAPTENSPMITTCTRMLSNPSTIVFDMRFQFLKKILAAPILVIVVSESQVEEYKSDKKFFELSPLENHARSTVNPAMLINKETYLFMINDLI